MKKLLSIIVFVFTHNLYATNCVPIISNVETNEDKKAVFTAITTNSFVSALNPENFKKLSSEDKEAIIEDEEAFLIRKIQKAVPVAEVLFIPKSLYQLFVYFVGHKQKLKTIDEISDKYFKKQVTDEAVAESDLQTCACWITGAKKDNSGIGFLNPRIFNDPLTGTCITETVPNIYSEIGDYYESPQVQAAFWDVNKEIISALETNKIRRLNKNALKTLTNIIIEAIDNILKDEQAFCTKVDKQKCGPIPKKSESETYAERFLKLIRIGSCLPTPITPLKDIIFDLIVKEHDSPKNTYCIYRTESSGRARESIADNRSTGQTISFSDGLRASLMRGYVTRPIFRAEKSIADNRSTDVTTSFSDGLGAGLMRDYESGSALGIMAKDLDEAYSDKMLCIVLPKRALLEHSIPVYIPPIIAMGSVLGNGEFHHPRIKSLQSEKIRKRGDFYGYESDKIPAYYSVKTTEEITEFWRSLEPVDCFEYDFFRYNEARGAPSQKTIVTEIYFLR